MGKIIGQGITFDDVLLVPGYSEVIANEVVTETRLTDKISLNIPLMSASMDTVTEHRMAIAMARLETLGHLTVVFSGAAEAGLPGSICVEANPMPKLKVGSKITIEED